MEWPRAHAADFVAEPHAVEEAHLGFGRGILLWLLGVPLPIIILLAIFWH